MTRWKRNFKRFKEVPQLGTVVIVYKNNLTGHDVKKIVSRGQTDVIIHAVDKPAVMTKTIKSYTEKKSILLISMDTKSKSNIKILRSAIAYVEQMMINNTKKKYGYIVAASRQMLNFKGADGKIINMDVVEHVTDGLIDLGQTELSMLVNIDDFDRRNILLTVLPDIVRALYVNIKDGIKYSDGDIFSYTKESIDVKFVARKSMEGKDTLRLVLSYDGKIPENILDGVNGYMLGDWDESFETISSIPGIAQLREALEPVINKENS